MGSTQAGLSYSAINIKFQNNKELIAETILILCKLAPLAILKIAFLSHIAVNQYTIDMPVVRCYVARPY